MKIYEFHMKNNDFATSRRFFVRQFYVFATWCAGKHSKTTISPKFSFDSSTFLQHQDDFRSTVLRFHNTDVRKTKQNNDAKPKMCDSSTFSLSFLEIRKETEKERKKNAANTAPSKRKSILRRFIREQKTTQAR